MINQETFYEEAFDRNIGILTKEQQEAIRTTKVAIAGLGGVGGIHAYALARSGFTQFHIADFDTFSVANFNRQAGATVATLDTKKTESIKNLILSINPFATVTLFEEGITEQTIDAFLDGVTIAIDGIDFFCIEPRRLLFRKAKEKGIFALTAGPVAFGSSLLVFGPHSPSFDEYMNINDSLSDKEKYFRFGIGITPSLLQARYFRPDAIHWENGEHRAPSLGVGTLIAANLVGTEAIKIAIGAHDRIKCVPHSLHFDPYIREMRRVWMPFGNKNPIQRIKLFIAKIVMDRKQNKK